MVWILGDHDNWQAPWSQYLLQPEGDLTWHYHQHNAQITDRGTVLVFDNGNHRASPGTEKLPAADNYSRVVEYKVNAEAKTVSQVWSYGGPESKTGENSYYCPFICGASILPETGNVLGVFGGLLTDESGRQSEDPNADTGWVRMVEVTGDAKQEKVWELFIDERAQNKGWDVYRAERFASLYG